LLAEIPGFVSGIRGNVPLFARKKTLAILSAVPGSSSELSLELLGTQENKVTSHVNCQRVDAAIFR
jgi:hypothetical protein